MKTFKALCMRCVKGHMSFVTGYCISGERCEHCKQVCTLALIATEAK